MENSAQNFHSIPSPSLHPTQIYRPVSGYIQAARPSCCNAWQSYAIIICSVPTPNFQSALLKSLVNCAIEGGKSSFKFTLQLQKLPRWLEDGHSLSARIMPTELLWGKSGGGNVMLTILSSWRKGKLNLVNLLFLKYSGKWDIIPSILKLGQKTMHLKVSNKAHGENRFDFFSCGFSVFF